MVIPLMLRANVNVAPHVSSVPASMYSSTVPPSGNGVLGFTDVPSDLTHPLNVYPSSITGVGNQLVGSTTVVGLTELATVSPPLVGVVVVLKWSVVEPENTAVSVAVIDAPSLGALTVIVDPGM